MQTSGMGESQNQSNKSSVGNTEYDLPSDLTGIVHAVINKIHTCGASRSSDPSLQLKSTLPAFCTLNRSVTKALAAGNANCCLIAQCLYEPSGALQTHTPTERKRASRNKNVGFRQPEQSLDSTRRKVRRLDISYTQGEQSHSSRRWRRAGLSVSAELLVVQDIQTEREDVTRETWTGDLSHSRHKSFTHLPLRTQNSLILKFRIRNDTHRFDLFDLWNAHTPCAQKVGQNGVSDQGLTMRRKISHFA